jgi:DNA helicase-2/ATP-dependent DNA helicase PcrA
LVTNRFSLKMSLMVTLSTAQKQIIEHEGSCSVIGAPGTGKTEVLIERVIRLVEKGVTPEDIYIVAFTYYSWQILTGQLRKRLGDVVDRLNIGTFRIFAQHQIEADEGKEFVFSSDKQARRYLRQAMREVSFKGSAVEAEHIIRNFKSLARKPQENAPHHDLLNAYRRFCELDRYDVLRKHIIGIRQSHYNKVPMKYMFVDNIQDITRIQFLWLVDHINAGTIASVFGDDDLCAFKRDGSIGGQAFIDLQDVGSVKAFNLAHSYRISSKLGLAAEDIVGRLKGRLPKDISYNESKEIKVTCDAYGSAEEELMVITQQVKGMDRSKRVGVITRTDWDALRVQRAFEKHGIEHSSFAHKIWEIPGAIMVLDLLCLLLNQATDTHLRNVLIGYGLNQSLIDSLFKGGLHALDWLPTGAKLPKDISLPQGALAEYTAIQRQLVGYYTLIRSGAASPQDIFKAASFDMVENMNKEDRLNALVAVDTLVNLKGSLREVLPQIREGREPNVHDQVIVGPVRDMRNLEFDVVYIPFATKATYPYSGYSVLPVDDSHDCRLFYMAVTRASEAVRLSWHGVESSYVSIFKKSFKTS